MDTKEIIKLEIERLKKAKIDREDVEKLKHELRALKRNDNYFWRGMQNMGKGLMNMGEAISKTDLSESLSGKSPKKRKRVI